MHKKYVLALSLFFFLTMPVYADEIQYSSLIEQHDDTLLIQYKGPGGATYYTCTVDGDCDRAGTEKPNIFPTLLGATVYPKSADGTLGVKSFTVGNSAFYILYDTTDENPEKIALIPYTQKGAKIFFAKNNTAVVFQKGLTFTRYDIDSNKIESVTLSQKLAFLSLSPDATYVTGYNYNALTHELWRFTDRKKFNTPPSMQSYLEFSEDETEIAFLEDVDSFKTLFTMKTEDLDAQDPSSLEQLTKPNTETEDYLFAGDRLYFMANSNGPFEWDLFMYENGDTTAVDTAISYGDFLKRVNGKTETYLAYLKTDGKNTHVTLLDEDNKKETLAPVSASSLSADVERAVEVYGGRNGVLLSPENPSRRPALFIWMHGGPQRQVAKAFHPYLSYAVYDELLERLAEAGNYVYKIDYTGSSGYGADFRKALTKRVGDIEMRDIENAIEDIRDDIDDISEVYLIGNSYGGYMALRGLVDFPEELDGVISINGVSDWYGLIQQIPSSPFNKVFDGVPDDHNLTAYYQASVFTGLEDLDDDEKALVVWGENDSTVPVWQSTKYIDFVEKKTDIELKTLSFPDEDHILRKRNNLDKLCQTVADFADLRGVKCEL